jgi:hypothetical protein
MAIIQDKEQPSLFLVFNQHFDRDYGLDWGRLSLNQLNPDKTLKIWTATSSVANLQKPEDFHQRGGIIPPHYRCGIPCWTVKTAPISMPTIKGVEGNFYKIDPHIVTTDKGAKRGDFGIHRDANVPGSMGCIVLSDDRFKDFEAAMRSIKNLNPSIPLFVFYS